MSNEEFSCDKIGNMGVASGRFSGGSKPPPCGDNPSGPAGHLPLHKGGFGVRCFRDVEGAVPYGGVWLGQFLIPNF